MSSVLIIMLLQAGITTAARNQKPPQIEISNAVLGAKLYLPDPKNGFYRGTRFDWSGVIGSLTYKQHDYYGPWFTKTDPNVIDFIFDGADIIAGPCSAITGPVEEFTWQGKALGFDEAKTGGTFIKIGVGVLRKPDDQPYNPYRLYEIADPGKWSVHSNPDSVQFIQELSDPSTGYAYRYTKTVRLTNGKSELVLDHSLENTGQRNMQTSVYDHNFLVLDNQPIGPDFVLTVPFPIHTQRAQNAELTRIDGHHFKYLKQLEDRETVSAEFSGFGETPADYNFTIENHKAGAGMHVTGNRPLSKANLWSIRSVLAVEPFIDMSIDPGKTFTWSYKYTYYVVTR